MWALKGNYQKQTPFTKKSYPSHCALLNCVNDKSTFNDGYRWVVHEQKTKSRWMTICIIIVNRFNAYTIYRGRVLDIFRPNAPRRRCNCVVDKCFRFRICIGVNPFASNARTREHGDGRHVKLHTWFRYVPHSNRKKKQNKASRPRLSIYYTWLYAHIYIYTCIHVCSATL